MTKRKKVKDRPRLDRSGGREEFLEALRKNHGRLITTYRQCHLTRDIVKYWRKKYPDFNEQIEEAKGLAIDDVEGKLYELIDEGETAAVIFYLKTKGRDRGYGEKYVPEVEQEESKPKIDPKAAKTYGGFKTSITNALKERGTYDKGLVFQIEIAALLMTKVKELYKEMFDVNHHTIIQERSREGNKRDTVSPLEQQFKLYLGQAQSALRALGLNTDTKQKVEPSDGFDDFYKSMEGE